MHPPLFSAKTTCFLSTKAIRFFSQMKPAFSPNKQSVFFAKETCILRKRSSHFSQKPEVCISFAGLYAGADQL